VAGSDPRGLLMLIRLWRTDCRGENYEICITIFVIVHHIIQERLITANVTIKALCLVVNRINKYAGMQILAIVM